jgi:hypothetical protein
MLLIKNLLEKPINLSAACKYTAMNGLLYLGTGALFIAWPGEVQTLFMEAPFVGHEGAFIRVIGLTPHGTRQAIPHDAMRHVTNFGSEKK